MLSSHFFFPSQGTEIVPNNARSDTYMYLQFTLEVRCLLDCHMELIAAKWGRLKLAVRSDDILTKHS